MLSTRKTALAVALGVLSGTATAISVVNAQEITPHVYAPGKEFAKPGVHNDITNTYKNWKDRDAIKKAIENGVSDEKINYKNIRWLETDDFNGDMVLEEARQVFNTAGKNGKSCASCHGDDASELKGVAATYPKFDKDAGEVVVLPTKVEMCAEKNTGTEIPVDSGENTLLTALINHQSHGEKISVDLDHPEVKQSFERGRDLFYKRVGQFDFACASCHTPPTALKKLRGMRPSTPYGDAASYPIFEYPASPDRHYLYTIQHQIVACSKAARMKVDEEGSPAYTDMEVFLRSLSNDHEINSVSTYYGESL